ncbi:MAG: RagB/SusD family nutrient uptake outer membrane protein, partial [Candidatus Cryptobacteroides sp.]
MENYLNGPDADAKEWLLEVRSRAFKGNEDVAETYVNSLSSKEDFFEAIVQERALEFCGEFLRKADLIRWNRLSSSLEAEKANLYALRDKTGNFNYLSGNIWYRLGDDEESIQIWGLGKDEQMTPEGDDWEQVANYVKYDDTKESDLYASKIENIYINNPDQYMFWPIFNSTISNSQGHIVNDYVYAAQ